MIPAPKLRRRQKADGWEAISPTNIARPFTVLGRTPEEAEDGYYRCYERMIGYGWLTAAKGGE